MACVQKIHAFNVDEIDTYMAAYERQSLNLGLEQRFPNFFLHGYP